MKKTNATNRRRELVGWALNAPYLLYSLVFFLLPLIWAFWLSMMDWNLMSKDKTFVGAKNFLDLFSDPKVQAAFINSYRYLLPVVLPEQITSFFLTNGVRDLLQNPNAVTAVLLAEPIADFCAVCVTATLFFLSFPKILRKGPGKQTA